jgi:hypothetical protein
MQKRLSQKSVFFTAVLVAVFAITQTAMAAGNPLSLEKLLAKIFYHLINPLIILGFVISLAVFMYGVVDFLRKRDSNAADANEGKNHLLYGLIGLFIFVSAFAIARIMNTAIVPDAGMKDQYGHKIRIQNSAL